MPFAGLWRAAEWPLDRPLPWAAGMSTNESLELRTDTRLPYRSNAWERPWCSLASLVC